MGDNCGSQIMVTDICAALLSASECVIDIFPKKKFLEEKKEKVKRVKTNYRIENICMQNQACCQRIFRTENQKKNQLTGKIMKGL